VSSQTTQQCAADSGRRTGVGPLLQGARPGCRTNADASSAQSAAAIGHYDLAVRHACEQWSKIRWSLFVFPDITDVAPTDDPSAVRIFYEGRRPYPDVWRVALLQAGFDVPALGTARLFDGSLPPARPRRLRASTDGAADAPGAPATKASRNGSNGHRFE
jgi:hypothetical protein